MALGSRDVDASDPLERQGELTYCACGLAGAVSQRAAGSDAQSAMAPGGARMLPAPHLAQSLDKIPHSSMTQKVPALPTAFANHAHTSACLDATHRSHTLRLYVEH